MKRATTTGLPKQCFGEKRNGSNGNLTPSLISKISLALKEKMEKAEKSIRKLREVEIPYPENGDFCEIATWCQARERVSLEIYRQQKFIDSCQKTKILIESGRYSGRCLITGEELPVERILLVPNSCFSITGKIAYQALKEKDLFQEFIDSGRYLSPEGLKFLGIT